MIEAEQIIKCEYRPGSGGFRLWGRIAMVDDCQAIRFVYIYRKIS